MNDDATQAVARLQARQLSTASTWSGDLLDETLDKLLSDADADAGAGELLHGYRADLRARLEAAVEAHI